jgi:hypothetical protein
MINYTILLRCKYAGFKNISIQSSTSEMNLSINQCGVSSGSDGDHDESAAGGDA